MMNEMLEFFDNEEYRQVFINPETNEFEPQLMAMVLGTAGTPGEASIPAILTNKNDTNRPARVV